MNTLAFLSLGFSEMLVIGVVALLVFGGRLPDVMHNLGRSYAKFRRGMNDLTNPIRQEMRKLDVTSPPPPPSSTAADDAGATTAPPPLYTPSANAVPHADAPQEKPDPPRSVPTPSGGAADEPPPV